MNQRKELTRGDNGARDVDFWGISFKGTTYTKAWLADVIDFLQTLPTRFPDFVNADSKVYHLDLSDFLQEFTSEEVLKSYKDFYNAAEKKVRSNYQFPFVRWEFDYNGKKYLLLWTKSDFSEKDITNLLCFQGIIFTHSEDIEETQWDVLSKITGIL